MLRMINSNVTESIFDIERKYKGCKIIVVDFYDDCNCNVTGKAYALSTDIDTHYELQKLCSKLRDEGEEAVVVGYYGEGYVGVQYEYKDGK